jgi:hypothetical protein
MKRSFSWPLFLAAAGVLSAATWFLVESRETRIAGTISALVIAWGFVRYCVVDDGGDLATATMRTDFLAGDDADTLVRNDIWSRGPSPVITPEQVEAQLKLPLLAVVSRRS